MKRSVFIIALLAIIVLFAGKNLKAQTHNLKLELSSLTTASLRLNYEHILNDKQSVMIRFGGMIPHSIPSYLYDPAKVEAEYGGTSAFTNRIGSINIDGEFRF